MIDEWLARWAVESIEVRSDRDLEHERPWREGVGFGGRGRGIAAIRTE